MSPLAAELPLAAEPPAAAADAGNMAAGTEGVPVRALPWGPGRGEAYGTVGREVHQDHALRVAGKGVAAGGKGSEHLAAREWAGGKETAAGPREDAGPAGCSRAVGPVLHNRLVPVGHKRPSAQKQQK